MKRNFKIAIATIVTLCFAILMLAGTIALSSVILSKPDVFSNIVYAFIKDIELEGFVKENLPAIFGVLMIMWFGADYVKKYFKGGKK
jgi:hypothetical protein